MYWKIFCNFTILLNFFTDVFPVRRRGPEPTSTPSAKTILHPGGFPQLQRRRARQLLPRPRPRRRDVIAKARNPGERRRCDVTEPAFYVPAERFVREGRRDDVGFRANPRPGGRRAEKGEFPTKYSRRSEAYFVLRGAEGGRVRSFEGSRWGSEDKMRRLVLIFDCLWCLVVNRK